MKRGQKQTGFTIVEVLVVIVVIAIIATISVISYGGVQAKARNTDRQGDILMLRDALEAYYSDYGTYPTSTGSTKINASWVTSADASWANLESQLVPAYLKALPKDPSASTAGNPAIYSGFNYDYIRLTNGWCGTSGSKPGYLLAYRLESGTQERKIEGDCPTSSTQPSDYSSSEYVRGD